MALKKKNDIKNEITIALTNTLLKRDLSNNCNAMQCQKKKKGSIYNLSNTCKIIYKQIIVSQNKRINYSKDDN